MDISRLNSILTLDTPKLSLEDKVQPQPAGQPSFGQMLDQALQQVEADSQASDAASVKLATGQTDNIAEVMIANERANLSLSLTLQVRNKLLEAYQEIVRMPL
ncbi:MAG TPA: flagellar hook-basal body complex protein FliE [Symbiobacteriaceae bacterium]